MLILTKDMASDIVTAVSDCQQVPPGVCACPGQLADQVSSPMLPCELKSPEDAAADASRVTGRSVKERLVNLCARLSGGVLVEGVTAGQSASLSRECLLKE